MRPIFPTLFSCTMLGLPLSLIFPGVPVAIFALFIEGAVITDPGRLLSAILLAGEVGALRSGTSQTCPVGLVISISVSMILGGLFKRTMIWRTARKGSVATIRAEPYLTCVCRSVWPPPLSFYPFLCQWWKRKRKHYVLSRWTSMP